MFSEEPPPALPGIRGGGWSFTQVGKLTAELIPSLLVDGVNDGIADLLPDQQLALG